MNVFRRWLVEHDLTPLAFYQLAGIGKMEAYRLAKGSYKRAPFTATLKRVAEVTGIPYEVLHEEFITPSEQRKDDGATEKRGRNGRSTGTSGRRRGSAPRA